MNRDQGEPAEFRRDARDVRKSGAEPGVPESRPGAAPAAADSPEFSRGRPLDEPQPSAREREELLTEEDESTDADVRSDKRDI